MIQKIFYTLDNAAFMKQTVEEGWVPTTYLDRRNQKLHVEIFLHQSFQSLRLELKIEEI